MNCLSRLKLYTGQWAVCPYGCSHRTGTSYSSNLPFPTYMHPPHKALLQKNACLENCTICREAAAELPWNATWPSEMFQGCNQPPAFWRCAEALGTLIEPCSTKSTMNFALTWQSHSGQPQKYSVRPILYNSGPGPLIWPPPIPRLFSKAPSAFAVDNPHTCWLLSYQVTCKSGQNLPSSTPTPCSLNIQLS